MRNDCKHVALEKIRDTLNLLRKSNIGSNSLQVHHDRCVSFSAHRYKKYLHLLALRTAESESVFKSPNYISL